MQRIPEPPAGMRNQPCECEAGACRVGLRPADYCVNRLRGSVMTRKCNICARVTWHVDGECVAHRDCLKAGHIHA